uniref:Protein GVQW3-like n=1 Tax=Diabrotica virgifera virgifera TaxID=50390 RepID=A0A6P7HBH5_DIAVI
MDKKKLKHCLLAKKNIPEAKVWLDKYYSDSAPGKSTVDKWFAKFKRDQMSSEDDARTGRPKEAVTDENIKKVYPLIGEKKNTPEAKVWLDKYYSYSAPGKSTVEKWFAKFKRDQMSSEDDARSGRPKEAVTDENIKKVYQIMLDDRKVKLFEIAETLKIK